MAISITRLEVKRKCMISSSDTSFDSYIESLITEMTPAIEQQIDPLHLANTADTRLQAALKLGALELVAGELLAQRAREPGFSEELQVGNLRIGQAWERGKALTEAGTLRLAPYLRPSASLDTASASSAAFGSSSRQMTDENMSGW